MTANALPAARAKGARMPVLVLSGLLAGPFLSMVDSNIVNVALPDIASSLNAPLTTAQWIVSGYLLALAGGLAASAYLARRYGTRRVYLWSLLGFTVASAACALAPGIGPLIALRAAQGALGAPLVPLAMNMLLGGEDAARGEFPAAAGIVLFLAPALGPTLGGLLIRAWGWPLVFLVNVPFGLLGALGTLRLRERPSWAPQPGARFDPFGMALLSGGLVLATYGATEGPQAGWASPQSWPYLASGAALLALYIAWALRRRHPAVDLKLLRRAQPALAVLLCTVASIVMFSMLVLAPIFMEQIQRASPLAAGLALLPQGLVTGLGVVLGGAFAARRGVRASAALGLLLLALTTAALLLVTVATPVWVLALLLSGRGLAVGLVIQPLLNAMLAGLRPAEIPDGNTLFNVAERLGGSLGISLLITLFSLREQARVAEALRSLGVRLGAGQLGGGGASQLPPAVRQRLADAAVAGFHDTVLALVMVAALGCLAALLLRDTAPAVSAERDGAAVPQGELAITGQF